MRKFCIILTGKFRISAIFSPFLLLIIFAVKTYSQDYEQYHKYENDADIYYSKFDDFTNNYLIATGKGVLVELNPITFKTVTTQVSASALNYIAVSKNNIAVSAQDKRVYILDKKDNKISDTIECKKEVIALAIHKNSLYFGGVEGKIYKYNLLKKSKLELVFSQKKTSSIYKITDIKINKENGEIIFCAGDIYVISLNKPYKLLRKIENKRKDFSTVAIHKRELAAWSYYQKKLLYSSNYLSQNVPFDTIAESKNLFICNINFLKNNLLISGLESSVFIYNTKSKKKWFLTENKHKSDIISVNSTKKNKIIATADINGVVHFWKPSRKFTANNQFCNKKMYLTNVRFMSWKSDFINTTLAYNDLDTLINFIKKQKKFQHLFLYGYRDVRAKKGLSQQRVDTVKKILQKRFKEEGIDTTKISGIGMGVPAKRDTINRVNNKRVDFEVVCGKNKVGKKGIYKKLLTEMRNSCDTNAIDIHELKKVTKVHLLVDKELKEVELPPTNIRIIAEYSNFKFFVITVGVAREASGYIYSSVQNEEIIIKRSVRARLYDLIKYDVQHDTFNKDSEIGEIFNNNDKFKYLGERMVDGITFYKFNLWGYIKLDTTKTNK